jgi:hypothetical protein
MLDMTWRRARYEARIRAATAQLRGAALAVAAAAAGVREQLTSREDCAPDDVDCLTGAYQALLDDRRVVARVASEIERLEHADVRYDGPVPRNAPRIGGHVPDVAAARSMVDRTHDLVLEALASVRDALARFDDDLVMEPAVR